jgi:hypothetical protein
VLDEVYSDTPAGSSFAIFFTIDIQYGFTPGLSGNIIVPFGVKFFRLPLDF